ncbi:MAG: hypothetical protein IKN49_03570 [Elusimicrobiaceae bacterium]|nr:hypothetical protein [Elusimicrobiaceae bacterium]
MTLSTTISKITYTGNGSTTQWDIPFPFLNKDDLRVYRIDSNGVITLLTSDYQINESTKVLTYPLQGNGVEPLPAGAKLLVSRNTPRTQGMQLNAQDTLDASLLEDGYDKTMMVCQELDEKISRCIQIPVGTQQQVTDTQSYLGRMEELFSQATETLEQAEALAQDLEDAQESAELAQAWATKTDGPVSGTEYSAKQYAQQVADSLSLTANTFLSNLTSAGEAKFTEKANTSLSNLTDSGQIIAAHASMPSSTSDTLTLGASGASYTAPADGYFSFETWSTATPISYFYLLNYTSDIGVVFCPPQGAEYQQKGFVPAKKGDSITLSYGNIDSSRTVLRFIYAVGATSEAN